MGQPEPKGQGNAVVRWVLFIPAAFASGYLGFLLAAVTGFLFVTGYIQLYALNPQPFSFPIWAAFFVMGGGATAPRQSWTTKTILLVLANGLGFYMVAGHPNHWLISVGIAFGSVIGIYLIPFPAFFVKRCREQASFQRRRIAVIEQQREEGMSLWNLLRLDCKLSLRPSIIAEYEIRVRKADLAPNSSNSDSIESR